MTLTDPPEVDPSPLLVPSPGLALQTAELALAEEPVAGHEVAPPGLPPPHHVVRQVGHRHLLPCPDPRGEYTVWDF